MNTTSFYERSALMVGSAILLMACGGAVTGDDAAAAGGGAAGGAGASAGGAGNAAAGATAKPGGGGGQGGAAVSTPCTPKAEPAAITNPTCSDLAVMDVIGPFVTNASGGAQVAPGDVATLHVQLREVAGVGFNVYPGVKFTSDNPGVTVKENDWRYAIFACQVDEMSATVTVAPTVPKGTTVTLTARVAMLNEECPAAPSVSLPIVVQ